ncbi:UDP-3-O-(3-hydroxymyristoyl)glucosamine N-acyltransferase [Paracoccus sp. 1_MG-2023]|uniref:UDP-3-O-(3-hydroxymyristoyl)glucosamine N-acyltransferase n=1 Tax=unclassified Paracoccus (in: a-proteobacteria) TaxID=2688777 RepID=UPI001C09F772|nr:MULTISPECIES: UDP-3-O-(3-hydroxymyristoyl)glucosamine N-acyltransferase [unclassified Paracoccus (in: a-proteobacteria)]MBU2958785.1 UDP-3-O-(3-hydroxymyristoyl)glucosamine N-acyltransferase [Paracoccus sp. C2R09]MDO6667778.1 UDP-3-O-(3-hydroxymyristoyl)glucosamine N-acyltransferase [Paracoccus sp. 1_MG-2023]
MAVTIEELARALDARMWGDGTIRVTGAGEPASTGPVGAEGGQIALAMAPKYADSLSPGSIALLAEGMDPEALGLKAAIFAPRPRLVMAGLTRAFDPGPDIAEGIHPTAVIDPSATIAEGASIAPFVVIGADVTIGARARIGAHVSIGRGAKLGDDLLLHPGVRIGHGIVAGDRLIVQSNAVIGGDGFSFVTPEESGIEEIRRTLGARAAISQQHWTRIHSLGTVEIGNDVEIGANATIDRGTIRATRIGSGTKIDNLVMLGHNVVVGEDCLLCSQVGIAGSSRVGDRVVLAGKVGVNDNIEIGDDVIAGGASKIFTRVPSGRVVLGNPAVKMETQLEIQKAVRRLPRLSQQLSKLQEIVTRLSEKD